MESIERSARTVEEAVDLALNKLQLTRDEVEVEIVSEGKGGILGWRSKEATVRVSVLGSEARRNPVELSEDQLQTATIGKEVVEKLLSLLEISATVKINGSNELDSPFTIDISDTDSGILIGRRGQTLDALQYLVNFISSCAMGSKVRVTVDVADYRKRRNEELENLAIRVSGLAKTEQRPITLEAMSAQERRIIHLTLRDDAGVTTESTGFGESRKVVVYPEII